MKDFEMTIDEYLPLRDVVFNTLRRAILKGGTGRTSDGDCTGQQAGSQPNTDP